MRLDHLLSKEHLASPFWVSSRAAARASVPGVASSLVEHWLFGLSTSSGRVSTVADAAGTTAGGAPGPSTLLGPEGTAALGPLGQDRL